MNKAEGAVAWAIAIANNPAHGYDQQNRWGPDYDCASLVISAWESVGVAVREAWASYTGNMKGAFLACGFQEVTANVSLSTGVGLQPGDVLLCAAHTAMVVSSGRIVAARINELGMNPEDYWWYLDLRRYGTCRHAGFGLGFERMVMYLTGISNIRDVELHPRPVGNAEF